MSTVDKISGDDMRRIQDTERRMVDGRAGWDASEYAGRDGITNAAYGSDVQGQRWATWHGRGTNLEGEHVFTAQRAMQLVPELQQEVVARPLYWQDDDGSYREITSEVANVRADGTWLANVTKRYQRVQPWESFQFMDDIVDSGEAKYHSVMVMRGGRTIAMLARIPETVTLLGMPDEEIQLYLYLTNSYDRSSGLATAITPVRVVCTNTETLALETAPRIFSIRHTESITGKLQAARQTLGIVHAYTEALDLVAQGLASQKLSRNGFERLMDELVPVPQVDPEKGKRRIANREETASVIRGIYEEAPNLENVRGTKWAALNAVTEYVDWFQPLKSGGSIEMREERHMRRQLETSDLKDRAYVLLSR